MQINPTELLKQLAGVGQIFGRGPESALQAGASGVGLFADLLKKAGDGTLLTGLAVDIEADAGVALTDAQLARLSIAADRAEAAGLRNALVLIDGQRLVLDVHARRITEKASSAGGVVGGIDGVIDLGIAAAPGGADGEPAAQKTRVTPPLRQGLTANASLARLLQEIDKG